MALLLNVLWIVFGGLPMAFGWLVAALVMAVTIIGLPWTPAALRIAWYTLLPFGQRVEDADTGPISLLGNLIWFVLAGWWLALGHLAFAIGHAGPSSASRLPGLTSSSPVSAWRRSAKPW